MMIFKGKLIHAIPVLRTPKWASLEMNPPALVNTSYNYSYRQLVIITSWDNSSQNHQSKSFKNHEHIENVRKKNFCPFE